MKQFLEPISRIPGVRTVALATPDGVPICVLNATPSTRSRAQEPSKDGEGEPSSFDAHALAALATTWVDEIARATAPLSWDSPQRFVLRAARGTLVVQAAPGAVLVVLIEGGLAPEELRLPMDSAVARLQRHVRALEQPTQTNERSSGEIPGALPRQSEGVPTEARTGLSMQPGSQPGQAQDSRVHDTPSPITSGD